MIDRGHGVGGVRVEGPPGARLGVSSWAWARLDRVGVLLRGLVPLHLLL